MIVNEKYNNFTTVSSSELSDSDIDNLDELLQLLNDIYKHPGSSHYEIKFWNHEDTDHVNTILKDVKHSEIIGDNIFSRKEQKELISELNKGKNSKYYFPNDYGIQYVILVKFYGELILISTFDPYERYVEKTIYVAKVTRYGKTPKLNESKNNLEQFVVGSRYITDDVKEYIDEVLELFEKVMDRPASYVDEFIKEFDAENIWKLRNSKYKLESEWLEERCSSKEVKSIYNDLMKGETAYLHYPNNRKINQCNLVNVFGDVVLIVRDDRFDWSALRVSQHAKAFLIHIPEELFNYF